MGKSGQHQQLKCKEIKTFNCGIKIEQKYKTIIICNAGWSSRI